MSRNPRQGSSRDARERLESRLATGIALGLMLIGGIIATGSTLEAGARTATLSETPVAPSLASDAGKPGDKRIARTIAIHRS